MILIIQILSAVLSIMLLYMTFSLHFAECFIFALFFGVTVIALEIEKRALK